MTSRELCWLANRLPKDTVQKIHNQVVAANDFLAGMPIPKQCIIAAQLALVELAMIQHGALRYLDRSAA